MTTKSKKPKPMRLIRVRLDFVVQWPHALDSLPPEIIHAARDGDIVHGNALAAHIPEELGVMVMPGGRFRADFTNRSRHADE